MMNEEQRKKLLCEQLELLAEKSRDYQGDELCEASKVMLMYAEFFENHLSMGSNYKSDSFGSAEIAR